MKPDQITNALELFNAAKIYPRHKPDNIRNKSLNHMGHDFNNKPQFIGMEADGSVWAYGINPACLVSGAVTEDHQIALTAESGMWNSMYSTPHEHIGKLNPIDYNWMEMLFPIDESFTEVERVECSCCNGHGQVSEMMREDGVCCDDEWVDVQCPDCLGAGSVTEVERVECSCCAGKGSYPDQSQDGEGNTIWVDETCYECHGAGSVKVGES